MCFLRMPQIALILFSVRIRRIPPELLEEIRLIQPLLGRQMLQNTPETPVGNDESASEN